MQNNLDNYQAFSEDKYSVLAVGGKLYLGKVKIKTVERKNFPILKSP